MSLSIRAATSEHDIVRVRDLFGEYVASIGIDMSFQGFDAELAGLPGRYAAPTGALFLVSGADGDAIGCVGVRAIDRPDTCEIKRLYVRDAGRRTGAGRKLACEAIEFAKAAGYREIVLDTLPVMEGAIALYRDLGFTDIPPYGQSAMPGTVCFGKRLS